MTARGIISLNFNHILQYTLMSSHCVMLYTKGYKWDERATKNYKPHRSPHQ